MKKTILFTAFFACAILLAWEMPRPAGHKPKGWSNDAKAWTALAKNPCEMDGAIWTCFYQNKPNPALNEKQTLLKPGIAWNYYSAWTFPVSKEHSVLFYEPGLLFVPPAPPIARSAAAGIQFEPEKEGTYAVEIAGKVKVEQPTAGHALLQIFLLKGKSNKAVLLKEFFLNSAKPGAFGKYPTEFRWNGKIEFQKETRLLMRLQSVNPGPHSCGRAIMEIKKFSIK